MPTHELERSFVDVERDRNVVREVRDHQAVPGRQDVADPMCGFGGRERGADEPRGSEDSRGGSELLDRGHDQRALTDPVTYLERDQQIVSHVVLPSQASFPRVRRPKAPSYAHLSTVSTRQESNMCERCAITQVGPKGHCRVAGTLPPFSASFFITARCSQIFIAAESFVSPL